MRFVGGFRATKLHDSSKGVLGGSEEKSIDSAQRKVGRSKPGGQFKTPKTRFYQQPTVSSGKRAISGIIKKICGCVCVDI